MAAVARRAMAAGHKGMIWEVMRRNARARAFYRRMAEESDEAIVVNCAGDDFRRLADEGFEDRWVGRCRRRRTVLAMQDIDAAGDDDGRPQPDELVGHLAPDGIAEAGGDQKRPEYSNGATTETGARR